MSTSSNKSGCREDFFVCSAYLKNVCSQTTPTPASESGSCTEVFCLLSMQNRCWQTWPTEVKYKFSGNMTRTNWWYCPTSRFGCGVTINDDWQQKVNWVVRNQGSGADECGLLKAVKSKRPSYYLSTVARTNHNSHAMSPAMINFNVSGGGEGGGKY